MERLTYVKKPSQFDRGKYPTKYTSRHTFQEVVARLAAYEDTGIEPEEVKEHEAAYIEIMTRTYGPIHEKIGQWLQAEKDGRLVVLPCKVGDMLYEVDLPKYGVITCKVLHIGTYNGPAAHVQGSPIVSAISVGVEVVAGHGKGSGYAFEAEDFGKSVFLTHEEAKAALEGTTA